jgi:hypothetical protein
MQRVTFVLKLDQAGLPGNAARMWLDTSRDNAIQAGEEVTLGTVDGKLWLAQRDLPDNATGMQFLVKFIAPSQTQWSFTARSDSNTLYEAAGQMTSTREALAGSLS